MSKQHYRADTYKARTSVGYLMKRAHALMLDNIEPAFTAHGFTFMQWVLLMYLRDGIALNPKDICREFRHDSGALTRLIDQMEQRGLIERRRGSADRRKVDLHLTRAGRRTVESLIPLVVDNLNLALTGFSRTEVDELTRLLNKLNASMETHLAVKRTGAAA